MRNRALIVLASILLVAADAPPNDGGKQDLKRLQGTWTAVSAEANGQKAPDEVIKGFNVVVRGNKITFTPETDKRESVFELDQTKTPKEIVVTPLDGPHQGKLLRGLYSLEKDLFKLCVDNEQGQPPTEFATKPGDGLRLLVLRRDRP